MKVESKEESGDNDDLDAKISIQAVVKERSKESSIDSVTQEVLATDQVNTAYQTKDELLAKEEVISLTADPKYQEPTSNRSLSVKMIHKGQDVPSAPGKTPQPEPIPPQLQSLLLKKNKKFLSHLQHKSGILSKISGNFTLKET